MYDYVKGVDKARSRCKICGRKEGEKRPEWALKDRKVILHYHHVVPRSVKLSKNTILVCSRCHGLIHSKYERRGFTLIHESDPEFFSRCVDEVKSEVG